MIFAQGHTATSLVQDRHLNPIQCYYFMSLNLINSFPRTCFSRLISGFIDKAFVGKLLSNKENLAKIIKLLKYVHLCKDINCNRLKK